MPLEVTDPSLPCCQDNPKALACDQFGQKAGHRSMPMREHSPDMAMRGEALSKEVCQAQQHSQDTLEEGLEVISSAVTQAE